MKDHFDKLLTVAVIAMFLTVFIHLMRVHPESPALAWVEKSVDIALGSLLTLITGQLLRGGGGGPTAT